MPCMNRREFIALGGAAATWPFAARAQQPAKMRRLGVLLYSTPQADPQMETIRRGLRELGYSEGQNLVMSYHYAEGKPERLADLAAALVRENPDLVLALGGDVAPSAVKATSIIPIVFVSSADPVQLGLAASLARPAGNATGVTLLQDDLASKRLELLKEAVPRVKHAAFVWNPDHPDNELREAERAAQSLNVGLAGGNARSRRSRDCLPHYHGCGLRRTLCRVIAAHGAQHPENCGLCDEKSASLGRRLGSLGACRRTSLLRAKRR